MSTSGRTANSSVERRRVALRVGDQRLDRVAGRRPRIASTQRRDVRHPAVGEVVAGHHREHGVVEAHPARRPRRRAPARRAPGGSGWRVSTRQNPHARVQRSPSTMNVAVPSAQHSDRFGQPASSHTVTRPRSRTVCLSAITSGPWRTFGRSHVGLARSRSDRPGASTPDLRRSRCDRRAVATSRRRPSARTGAARERRQVVGPVPPRHVLALERAALPTARRRARATTSTTSRHRGRRCPPRPATSPAGRRCRTATMCSRMYVRSVVDVEGEAVHRAPVARGARRSAQILRGSVPSASTHTPGYSASRPAPGGRGRRGRR